MTRWHRHARAEKGTIVKTGPNRWKAKCRTCAEDLVTGDDGTWVHLRQIQELLLGAPELGDLATHG